MSIITDVTIKFRTLFPNQLHVAEHVHGKLLREEEERRVVPRNIPARFETLPIERRKVLPRFRP